MIVNSLISYYFHSSYMYSQLDTLRCLLKVPTLTPLKLILDAKKYQHSKVLVLFIFYGAGERNRTINLLITNQLLYH